MIVNDVFWHESMARWNWDGLVDFLAQGLPEGLHLDGGTGAFLPIAANLFPLMPFYGSVWPVSAYPYNLGPYVLVSWTTTGTSIAWHLSTRYPYRMASVGETLTGEAEESEAHFPEFPVLTGAE